MSSSSKVLAGSLFPFIRSVVSHAQKRKTPTPSLKPTRVQPPRAKRAKHSHDVSTASAGDSGVSTVVAAAAADSDGDLAIGAEIAEIVGHCGKCNDVIPYPDGCLCSKCSAEVSAAGAGA